MVFSGPHIGVANPINQTPRASCTTKGDYDNIDLLYIPEEYIQDKYEFYIQPQYVNQGTATPCHYQVLYEDRDLVNEDNNLKLEELQIISFYLSFYYSHFCVMRCCEK